MKKAIVIGASSGIGRELSKLLSADGYDLAIAARRVPLLQSLQDELPNGALIKPLDVSKPDMSKRALSALIKEMGTVDLIVFAAGGGELNETFDWSLEHASITTNVIGFAAIANVAMTYFMRKQSGHLVAISSIAAIRGGKASPSYNASKAFISNYLQGLRQKVTSMNLPITVTDIQPGFVDTAMAKGEGLFWVAPAQKAAKQIYRGIKNKKDHLYVTKRWRIIAWLLKVMPESLYKRL